jgi:hypothetical protein
MLEDIQNLYDNFQTVKDAGDNPNLKIPILTKTELRELSAKILKVRMNIVSGN